jgi:filamentous hemagglutinin family protein
MLFGATACGIIFFRDFSESFLSPTTVIGRGAKIWGHRLMHMRMTRLFGSTAAIALAALHPAAFAQSPQAPTVAAGSIAVTRDGATTVVTQSTPRGIIDWRSFSIGPQNAVRFDQPGTSSVTLNRITGTEATRIDGSLSANGQVWLANPNGVMIGPGGQVNVGGLLATTGRVNAQDFLTSGRALIDQIAKDAAIVNSGTINIAEGGYAALAAASIRNDGVIAARAGSVTVNTVFPGALAAAIVPP